MDGTSEMLCSLVPALDLKGSRLCVARTILSLTLKSYVLFSIGNLASLFKAAWPTCWSASNPNSVCDPRWIAAVSYLEVVGIITGQVLVGILGDW